MWLGACVRPSSLANAKIALLFSLPRHVHVRGGYRSSPGATGAFVTQRLEALKVGLKSNGVLGALEGFFEANFVFVTGTET